TKKSKTPRALIEKLVPDVVTISSGAIHATRPGLEERFVHFDDDSLGAKYQALLGLLYQSANSDHRSVRVLVFVSSPERAERIAATLVGHLGDLKEAGIDASVDAIHGNIERHARTETIIQVANSVPASGVHVIVSTDVASRGIDFKSIDKVIHLDFPRDAATYIHRVGRTCRGNSETGECKHGLV
ncbi:hypothetical protein HDU91_001391, partial [Kappamyces sp. JEL0680]